MLSGGELQGGTAWLTAGVAGWWWLRDVLCRGAPACVDWDWDYKRGKKSPPTRGGVACLFIMHHGKLWDLAW